MESPHNQPGAVNGGTALRFQIERHWPAVADPERWRTDVYG